jgi:hypothetical protein
LLALTGDYYGFETFAVYGGCIFDSIYVDSDLVSLCPEGTKPMGNLCVLNFFDNWISAEEDCEDFGGTWIYPSETKAECEARKVNSNKIKVTFIRDVKK